MRRAFLSSAAIVTSMALAVGCTQTADETVDATAVQTAGDEHGHAGHDHAGHNHGESAGAASSHGGWWCAEHGVPEEVCALCNSKLAAEFQRKGDWCADHERPDSQCFACHPELAKRFAAQYEAKYGKQPPKPEG